MCRDELMSPRREFATDGTDGTDDVDAAETIAEEISVVGDGRRRSAIGVEITGTRRRRR